MIPYDQLPPDKDHRTHVSFIKTELAARMGAVTTGVSTGAAFVESLEAYLRLVAAGIAVCVGLATLTYYVLASVEKWRNLRRDEE
jgi:hypothetical protein